MEFIDRLDEPISMSGSSPSLLRAFSLLEVLFAVAIVGILAALALPSGDSVTRTARETKLRSDVLSVNEAVRVYLASGGSLEHIANPHLVLAKLKTRRADADYGVYAGFRESMVDARLGALLTADPDDSETLRAVWNPERQRFLLARSGVGVREFILDDLLGQLEYGVEERDLGTLAFNADDGWIWSYDAFAKPIPKVKPTWIRLGGDEVVGEEAIPDEDDGEVSGDLEFPPVPLFPPTPSVPPGPRSRIDYPFDLSLIDTNGIGTAKTMASLNGSEWREVTGPIRITGPTTLAVFAAPRDSRYLPSEISDFAYSKLIIRTPNRHAISNIVFYLKPDATGRVRIVKAKLEGFQNVHEFDPDSFLGTYYPDSGLAAYTVKAGKNTSDMGPGEGELVILDPTLTVSDLPTGSADSEYSVSEL
jgi:prepilin-type N-terminal cleavage/methylation domain-containing protein